MEGRARGGLEDRVAGMAQSGLVRVGAELLEMGLLQPNSEQVRFAPSIKAGSDNSPIKTEMGVTRESRPRLVLLVVRVTYCAVVAGAAGATDATGA